MLQTIFSPKDLSPHIALARICQLLAEKNVQQGVGEKAQEALERDFLILHGKLAGLLTSGGYSEEAEQWVLEIQRAVQSLYQQYEKATESPFFYFGQLAAAFTQARQGSLRLLPERAVRAVFRSVRGLQILRVLHEKGPLTVGTLAEHINVRQNNLGSILDPLEEVGVVRKEQFGRTKRVSLLPIGIGILARVAPTQMEVEDGSKEIVLIAQQETPLIQMEEENLGEEKEAKSARLEGSDVAEQGAC